jgi:hypothetical protein
LLLRIKEEKEKAQRKIERETKATREQLTKGLAAANKPAKRI